MLWVITITDWLIQAYNDPMNKVVKSTIYDVYEKRV